MSLVFSVWKQIIIIYVNTSYHLYIFLCCLVYLHSRTHRRTSKGRKWSDYVPSAEQSEQSEHWCSGRNFQILSSALVNFPNMFWSEHATKHFSLNSFKRGHIGKCSKIIIRGDKVLNIQTNFIPNTNYWKDILDLGSVILAVTDTELPKSESGVLFYPGCTSVWENCV